MPERIQRRRMRGWRLPDGSRCVTRPGAFANPFKILKPVRGGGRSWRVIWTGRGPGFHDAAPAGFEPVKVATQGEAQAAAAQLFRAWLARPEQAGLRARVQAELRGVDLACYCPAGMPCHADALIELASQGPAPAPVS